MAEPQSLYRLRVELQDIEPLIWREIDILGNATLDDLHVVLQVAFGWENAHLHMFRGRNKTTYQPANYYTFDSGNYEATETTAIADVLPRTKSKFTYIYDFGDDWAHTITAIATGPAPADFDGVPRVVSGARNGPPEDCGGAWGFMDLLRAFNDPDNADDEALDKLEWAGDYDPDRFDPQAINAKLRAIFRPVRRKAKAAGGGKSKAKKAAKKKAAGKAKTPADPVAAVTEALDARLEAIGMVPHLRELARRIWSAFVKLETPTIRKPAVFVAAMEYYMRNATGDEVSQPDVAVIHGVSAGAVSQAYRRIDAVARAEMTPHFASAWGAAAPGEPVPMELSGDEREVLRGLPFLPDSLFVGGRIALPEAVVGTDASIVPHLVIWADVPNEIIRAMRIVQPDDPPRMLGEAFIDALQSPHAGEPGRPETVQVADAATAAMLEPIARDLGIDVQAADPATVDELMAAIAGTLSAEVVGEEDESFLESGLSADEAADFFRAAMKLVKAAPWRFADDAQLLEIDFHGHFGLRKAAVSVLGMADEARGLAVFSSMAAFQKFADFAAHPSRTNLPDIDSIALLFGPKSELASEQVAEIRRHKWPVAGGQWYPQVMRAGTHGVHVSLGDDVRVARICAEAVAAFVPANRALFAGPGASASLTMPITGVPELPEITITGPHELPAHE